ncbi:hypothetical protein F4775DRAFT_540696 [Biscogniauxia sp. FL1348]|nr:hypothetical protein F4775DRAFT_540696 [Biscogniauxia sp. FL1348]
MTARTAQLPFPATRDDFEIAIICALPREARAVKHVCDHLFEDDGLEFLKTDGDNNHYTTGRIGYHNVVVVWLEHMGKEAAARASACLFVSYRKIRLALLVGICGGSPKNTREQDIFLGDVIISSQIYQYDFKRLYPNGDEVRDTTMHMKSDPAISAIVNRLSDGDGQEFTQKLANYVRDLAEKQNSSMYKHPGIMKDILFAPEYLHKHQHEGMSKQDICMTCSKKEASVCKKARDMSCIELGCDPKLQVKRNRLDSIEHPFGDHGANETYYPQVHFGIMACGDTVIKSGKDRDDICRGSGAIAFEMESAGMFGSYAGIVIKSVCDYADSHKNKIWQDYAAGTAACAAKALLSNVTPTERANRIQQTQASRDFLLPRPRLPWVNFVDRNEILCKMECFIFNERPSVQQKRFVLCGMAGSGKTQLCLRFAQIHKKRFRGVFEVDASSRAVAESDFAAIAKYAGHDATFENGKSYLENYDELWLLILDNFDSKGVPLRELLPENDLGCVLITTRCTDLIYEKVNLNEEPMTIDEGITLFLKDAAKDPTNEQYRLQAEPLVKELGCLPLALHHAAGPVRGKLCSLGDMVEYYRRNKEELLNRRIQGADESTYEHSSTYASIGMSLQTMTAPPQLRSLDRALDILQICAFLHFKDIPESVLISAPFRERGRNILRTAQEGLSSLFSFSWLRNRRTTLPYRENDLFDQPARIHEALDSITFLPIPELQGQQRSSCLDENREALALLNSSGLGSFDIENGMFSLHPLVHEWNRSRLGGHDVRWARWSAAVALSRSISYRHSNNGHDNCRRKLLSHVDFFLRTGDEAKAVLGDLTVEQACVAEKFALVYQDNGNFEAARALCEISFNTMQQSLGKSNPDTLRCLYCLATVLERQRNYTEAREYSEMAWEGFKAIKGTSSQEALKCLNICACSLHGLGLFSDAERMYRDCLRAQEKTTTSDAAFVATIHNNLALAVLRQSKLPEAVDYLNRAYSWRKKELGEHNTDTMQTLHDLASTLRKAGEFKNAVEMARKVLADREHVLGRRHPDTLASMVELALVERRLGHTIEAERLSKEAIDGMKNRMGSTNPDTLESLSSLASTLRSRGSYQEAEELYRGILKGYGQHFSSNHDDVLTTKGNLAGVLAHLQRREEAEEIFREVISGFKTQYDSQHQKLISCQISLAESLGSGTDPGKLDEADALHREVEFQIEGSHLKYQTLKSDWLYNYALFLRNRKNYEKAAEKAKAALEGYKEKLGPESPAALDSLASLAYILDLQNNYKAAWEHYRQALEGYGMLRNHASIHYRTCEARFTAMRDRMRSLGILEPYNRSGRTYIIGEEIGNRSVRKRRDSLSAKQPARKKQRRF